MGHHPSLLLRGGRRLFPLLMAGAAALSGADYKIDQGLLNTLTDDEGAVAPFFVVFGERPLQLKQAYRIPDRIARARFVAQALESVANRSQAGVRGYLRGRGVAFTPFWIENKIYVPQGTLELARALSQRPEVVAILPEVIHVIPPPQVGSGSSIQAIEWGISKIRAPEVWSTGNKGQGIVVANIDTGVQYTHPALTSQYRGAGGTHLGNWKDPYGLCGSTPCDNNGHGTHTMGTMVGDDGAGNQVGVAPLAKWIACKGCRTNSCYDSDLIACAQWVVNPDGAAPPHIVNNSWGGGGHNPWYQSYVQSWVAGGLYPAFSNGNSGPGCTTSGSPGDYPESISAGATDISDTIASFSSRGPSLFGGIKPDLSAPGYNVRSSYPPSTYATLSGTSMASPHIAGTVALVWASSGLVGNIAGTEQVLKDSAVVLTTSQTCGGISAGTSPNNTYGWGRIDAKATVDRAGGGPPNQPPSVTITAPGNGSSFPCGSSVTFTGTSSDPDGPDPVIQWSDDGAGFGSGTSVIKPYACTTADIKTHTIVASVTDAGGLGDTDTINITIYDPSVPAAPTNLTAAVVGPNVNLSWTDNSTTESIFRVQRKLKSVWSDLATVPVDTINYTDLNPGKGNWQYRVRAEGVGGQSAWSNSVSARVR